MNGKHRDVVAMRKLGPQPQGFSFYAWQSIGPDAVKMTGCVSSGVFDGTPKEVVVTDSEVVKEAQSYQEREGKCANCLGEGQEFYGWTKDEGAKYRTCGLCGGSGLPRELKL